MGKERKRHRDRSELPGEFKKVYIRNSTLQGSRTAQVPVRRRLVTGRWPDAFKGPEGIELIVLRLGLFRMGNIIFEISLLATRATVPATTVAESEQPRLGLEVERGMNGMILGSERRFGVHEISISTA